MNKPSIIFTTICIIAGALSTRGQNQQPDGYREKVHVYINNDFLITGETLYYSIHCVDAESNHYSGLSKLVYLELIGDDEQPVLQTKVPLLNGTGVGDFFIPSNLMSGNFTLIAYTKWMRNFSRQDFFRMQLTIVNPRLKATNDRVSGVPHKFINASDTLITTKDASQLQIVVDKTRYVTREKVTVVIKNNDPVNGASISLNVHGHRNYQIIDPYSAIRPVIPSGAKDPDGFVNFLPDLRGETITGRVLANESHLPIANTDIYLSIPGKPYNFHSSRTDSTGRFYFTAKNIQTQDGIRFQLDPTVESHADVTLDQEFVNDYRGFKPSSFSVDTSFRKMIEQRSVFTQIENAYFFKKHDSIPARSHDLFFGKPDKVYRLDDFTRFPTMEDIFREYIYEVVVAKRNDKFTIRLLDSYIGKGARFSNTPIIIIDGLRIFDIEMLMKYNPLLIEKISLITRSYFYAGTLYDGILSINTYTGTAKDLTVVHIQKEFIPWQVDKAYYFPNYENSEDLKRIPDFRYQLYWDPLIRLEAGKEVGIEFYTSDVKGNFSIEVGGLDGNGKAIRAGKMIDVGDH